jgi:hypothetical protein
MLKENWIYKRGDILSRRFGDTPWQHSGRSSTGNQYSEQCQMLFLIGSDCDFADYGSEKVKSVRPLHNELSEWFKCRIKGGRHC